jgi:hypothetical protein
MLVNIFKNRALRYAIFVLTLALLILFVVLYQTREKPQKVETNAFSSASFSVFYPSDADTTIEPNKQSIEYDKKNNGMVYDIDLNDKKVTITQQPVPDVLEEKNVYDYKIQQSRPYESFTSPLGTVQLTKPKELNGNTLAWAKSKGTLLLARSYTDLSVNEWRQLFDGFIDAN